MTTGKNLRLMAEGDKSDKSGPAQRIKQTATYPTHPKSYQPAGSGPRSNMSLSCWRCGEDGHGVTRCMAPEEQILPGLCGVCGRKEHGTCTTKCTCTRCGKPGHNGAVCRAPAEEVLWKPGQAEPRFDKNHKGKTFPFKKQPGKSLKIIKWSTPAEEIMDNPLVAAAIRKAKLNWEKGDETAEKYNVKIRLSSPSSGSSAEVEAVIDTGAGKTLAPD